MFCKKCGGSIQENELVCRGCGLPAGPPFVPLTPEAAKRDHFSRTVHQLGRFYYLFAGLSVALAVAGLIMVQIGQTSAAGPWEPWPHPQAWAWTLFGITAWTFVSLRVAVAIAAGWGLMNSARWGRVVAFLAATLAITQFPIGAVLGVYTFVVMTGRRCGEFYHERTPSRRPGPA